MKESLMKCFLILFVMITLFYAIVCIIKIKRSIYYNKLSYNTIEQFQYPNPSNVTKSQIQVAVPHDCPPEVQGHITKFQHLHAVQATQSYYDRDADVEGVLGSTSCDVKGKPFEIPPDPHCFEEDDQEDEPQYASNDDISDAVDNQDPFD